MIGKIFQVEKTISETGFIRVVAHDNSPPHPAAQQLNWNWIVEQYNPVKGTGKGQLYLSDDSFKSIVERNEH